MLESIKKEDITMEDINFNQFSNMVNTKLKSINMQQDKQSYVQSQLQSIFAQGDTNKNNQLSKSELSSVLGMLNQVVSLAQEIELDNKKAEPKSIEDKGEFDQIAKNYMQASKNVNAVDQNTRTWTQDENGRFNDCPEAIEFYQVEDQFHQYLNDKLGEPAQKGETYVIVSNGHNYQFKAQEKADGTLFWNGSTRPID